MVDDSHAVGFMGRTGRGTHEHHGVMDRIDIITGTLGKALGGASGGYTSGRREIIELLRQRSRPYLFSNSLAPTIVGASLTVLELLVARRPSCATGWRRTPATSAQAMHGAGFNILPGEHPIVPIMLGDARLAQDMAARLLERGVYVIGFFYPVVPQGKARIRVQVSAAHTGRIWSSRWTRSRRSKPTSVCDGGRPLAGSRLRARGSPVRAWTGSARSPHRGAVHPRRAREIGPCPFR